MPVSTWRIASGRMAHDARSVKSRGSAHQAHGRFLPLQRRERDVLAGRSPDMVLLRAVRRFVESRGGAVLVIGCIEIQDWHEGALNFRVAVRCTGRRPKRAAEKENERER